MKKRINKTWKWLQKFPRVPTKVWIDCWCFTAFVKFVLGKPIDSVTLLGILGLYTANKVVNKGQLNDN